MKQTLLNRFQGALFGGLIAEQISHQAHLLKFQSLRKIHLSSWSQLQWQIIDDLINYQGCYFAPETQAQFTNLETLENSSKLALATIGLNLYTHESVSLWEHYLQKLIINKSQLSDAEISDLLIWTNMINLILKEEIKPHHCLNQLLAKIPDQETVLAQKINIIAQQQSQGKSSREISKILKTYPQSQNTPIAMAIYYFSDTIGNSKIKIERAKQSDIQPLITSALTGILSGLDQGWDAFSLKWKMMIKQQPIYDPCELLTQKLFALWCGVCTPQDQLISPNLAIASPNLIQPRRLKEQA